MLLNIVEVEGVYCCELVLYCILMLLVVCIFLKERGLVVWILIVVLMLFDCIVVWFCLCMVILLIILEVSVLKLNFCLSLLVVIGLLFNNIWLNFGLKFFIVISWFFFFVWLIDMLDICCSVFVRFWLGNLFIFIDWIVLMMMFVLCLIFIDWVICVCNFFILMYLIL